MVALFSLPLHSYAQKHNETAPAQEPVQPMAFFEFLAELEQVDGEWLSPLDLQDTEQLASDSAKDQEKKP